MTREYIRRAAVVAIIAVFVATLWIAIDSGVRNGRRLDATLRELRQAEQDRDTLRRKVDEQNRRLAEMASATPSCPATRQPPTAGRGNGDGGGDGDGGSRPEAPTRRPTPTTRGPGPPPKPSPRPTPPSPPTPPPPEPPCLVYNPITGDCLVNLPAGAALLAFTAALLWRRRTRP